MSTLTAPVPTKESLRHPADGREELLFVPLWGQVVECYSPLDAAIIGEISRSFGSVDLGKFSAEELERLIAEFVPSHLEATASAIRRRAAACVATGRL